MRQLCALMTIIMLVFGSVAYAQSSDATPSDTNAVGTPSVIEQVNNLNWQNSESGPGKISDVATVRISEGLEFLGPPDAGKFTVLNGNLPDDGNYYILSKKDFSWFALFSYDPSGHVRDDEKIDPDALLTTMKANQDKQNEKRKSANLDTLTLTGWYVPPHYDVQTKRLEWGTRLISGKDNSEIVNYTVRLLGRRGVMAATLVAEPKNFDTQLSEFKSSLNSFNFNTGENYAEFRSGDKVAEYGLGALVLGGAAAVAVKSGAGLFKAIGLGIVAAVAAVLNWLKRAFRKKAP